MNSKHPYSSRILISRLAYSVFREVRPLALFVCLFLHLATISVAQESVIQKEVPQKEAPAKSTTQEEAPTEKEIESSNTKPIAEFSNDATPGNAQELLAIEQKVQAIVEQARKATVGVVNGAAQGSGVIIGKEGYVLTAGHVAGKPDRKVTLILSDGRKIKGKTLGINSSIDSGLIKITDKGEFPSVEMGTSKDLKDGTWCLSTGHPGGFRKDRPPVVRVGRVISTNQMGIRTDCALIGGDSGGPLYDLDGKVIGIHSRISGSLTANFHVPIDTFHLTWDRLVKGEQWGGRLGQPTGPILGIRGVTHEKGCRIDLVVPDSPAEKAELEKDDIILSLNLKKVEGLEGLIELIGKQKVGDEVTLEILRGDETLIRKAKLGKRS